MDFIDLCKKIIFIDSTPSGGTEDVTRFASDLCAGGGMDVTLQEGFLAGKKQFNIIARPKHSFKKHEVVFQTHLDTVEPGPKAAWTETENNPFQATVKNGNIYGLGTADVKLDFLCKWRALKEIAHLKQKFPFALVGTFGEEMGMEGSKLLLSEKAVDAKMAIIGEPSELKIVYANNGYGVCRFEIPFLQEELDFIKNHQNVFSASAQEKIFHGKAVHSSTPHLGENAILKLVDYLSKMPDGLGVLDISGGTVVNVVPAQAHLEMDAGFMLPPGKMGVAQKIVKLVRELQKLEREFLNFENESFSPATPTLNIGVLKTNQKHIELFVSFRFTPQILQKQIDLWWHKLETECGLIDIHFVPERVSPAALTPLESPLVQGALTTAKKLSLPEKPITKASGTECSVYRKYEIDCIVFGPGVSIGNSHTANEYNILKQLDLATEFYIEMAKRFCL